MDESFYAGIGSRKTPEWVLAKMTYIANKLALAGYTLNSGGADGADTAFELGAGSKKQIFIPWNGYNDKNLIYPIHKECYEIAAEFHPAWDRLSGGARALMARNVLQVLGKDLDEPVDFVVCWTPDAVYRRKDRTVATGGTGLAISVADTNGIPIFNLADDFHREFVLDFIERL